MQNKTRLFIHRFMVDYTFRGRTVSTVLEVPTYVGELPELPFKIWPCFSAKNQELITEHSLKPGLTGLVIAMRNLAERQFHTSGYYVSVLEKYWEALRIEFAQHSGLFVVDPNHPRPEVRTMLGASVGNAVIRITTSSIAIQQSSGQQKRETTLEKLEDVISRLSDPQPESAEWLRAAVESLNEELQHWPPERVQSSELLVVPVNEPGDDEFFEIYRPVIRNSFVAAPKESWTFAEGRVFAIDLQATATPIWLPVPANPAIVFDDPSISMENFELIGIVDKLVK